MNPLWPAWIKVFYVLFCTVGMFAVMTGLAWLIQPYADAGGAWFYQRFGAWPIIIAIPPLWYLAYRWNR